MITLKEMLAFILPHVEHYYHTHLDEGGKWWNLITAIRIILEKGE